MRREKIFYIKRDDFFFFFTYTEKLQQIGKKTPLNFYNHGIKAGNQKSFVKEIAKIKNLLCTKFNIFGQSLKLYFILNVKNCCNVHYKNRDAKNLSC